MHKHLHLVPSLVVIFFELDWNDSAFKERQMELKDKIDVIRSEHQGVIESKTRPTEFLCRTSLDGHGATISVVLLQNKNYFPTGNDRTMESVSFERR
jgi:hypothetical protein